MRKDVNAVRNAVEKMVREEKTERVLQGVGKSL